jgi:hypothetical protein
MNFEISLSILALKISLFIVILSIGDIYFMNLKS